jgi:PAS domain S-box-containing protein
MTSHERPTALVVNDEPSQLRLVCAILERAGIRARGCTGVEEALTSLQADPAVELIITDLHMPGIDGWQFCLLLRSPEYPRFNRVPILVVSATFSGNDAEQLSLDLGADAFLAAPFAPSVLQQYVTALLNGQRPQPAPGVLVVHHDPDEAARLRTVFADNGYTVEVAHNGAEALRAWHARRPEVAVLDEQIADVSAERILAEIKKPGCRTVVFAITSDAASRGGLLLARLGADGTLPAPADASRLISLCAKVRRQRALTRIEELLEERGRALRESETRWRSLFDAIPEIVVVHDDDGVIRHINRTGAERLELPAHELIGRRLRDFERRADADREPPGEGSFETVYVSRSGTEIPAEVNRRRMTFEGQRTVLSVARDVSARHELARQRRDFLAMLTHDIKSPLAIVLGVTDLLGEVGDLNAEQRDLVGRLEASANTVLALVANYLQLEQIESGTLTVHKRAVELAEMITSVAAQYRGQAERQDIALSCEIEGALGIVPADAVALERVFANLLHNALKFTPEGGRIAIRARREPDAVVVRVSDSGIGIAPGELATVFQPYRRGVTRQPNEGVGLGLFVAQSLLVAHQGRIEVESAPGQGTAFSVWLPTGGAAAAVAAAPGA